MSNSYVKRWQVIGTSGKEYVVSVREDGVTYGCSCPAWIFSKFKPKPDCQHILQIKLKQATPGKVNITKITDIESKKVIRAISFEDV